ncbi:MAG TPA: type III-B CRISPR module-associated Cmr3 family protein [Candidatus Dormibacteraeota bacterium]|nr:type III-B CRISPR module-associated Cmr3 family protein [Candidatus Dormibacteraeota bacterium]
MSAIRSLALVPRDGVFCKDGRGWYTTALGRAHGTDWPWPSTVLGALRSAWGRGLEERQGRRLERGAWPERTREVTLGPSLALRRPLGAGWAPEHRAWPAPADALKVRDRERLLRLQPGPRDPAGPKTLGRDDDPAREALWLAMVDEEGKPERMEPWWSEEHFIAWLAGEEVPARAEGRRFSLPRRLQSHVTIRDEQLTAEDGNLFSHDVLETLEGPRGRDVPGGREPQEEEGEAGGALAEWAIGVEARLPDPFLPRLGRLGSDGRLVRIEPLPEPLFAPPPGLLAAFARGSAGLRLVVVTPASFARGWLPDGLERLQKETEIRGRLPGVEAELVLRAAMVPRPLHVSGWDMVAGAPKPVSRLVAPGAVYFFERADGGRFGEAEARALWLAAVGSRTEEGYGRVVPGVWNPNQKRS